MKTLIISLTLALFASLSHAQVIELSEAKVGFEPIRLKADNTFSINVKEKYAGEFEKNPLVFLENNFDITGFIDLVKEEEYDSYEVSFRSKKGALKAEFDKEGNLVKTSQKFKDIEMPREIMHQLYRDYKGWTVVKNTHIASGREGKLDHDYYLITMRNGKQKENLKIDTAQVQDYVVASK